MNENASSSPLPQAFSPPPSPPPPPPTYSPPSLEGQEDAPEPPVRSMKGIVAANLVTSGGGGGNSSSFSSPLPPCPEDPPAPPPPSCTPPKYHPSEENDNTEEDEDDTGAGNEAEQQDFPTPPPPPPSPPRESPMGTPPPPPPPYSPPSVKDGTHSNDSPEDKHDNLDVQMDEEEQQHMDADDETVASEMDVDQDDLMDQEEVQEEKKDRSTSSYVAAMRSAASDKEIMGTTDTVKEVTKDKPRWHLGDIESYTIIDKVGSGTYGEVFKCMHKVTKDIVALKKLRQDVEKNGFPVTSIREMKILKSLKHPNIVELKEIVSTKVLPKEGKKPPLYFAFEYMEHDLSGLLNHPRVKFSRTQIQCYMRQLLCGIAFMHLNKIIHRDIKASNLLLNNQGMLKIADFGLSRFWNEVNAKAGRYTNKVVTLWYRSPELLMGSTSYDFSVDIWSVGCIFGELLLGRPILQGKTEIEQLQLIFGLCGLPNKENWPDFEKLPGVKDISLEEKYVCRLRDRFKSVPPLAVDLLEKLLTLDPAKRITAVEALDHDYFWRVLTCKPRDLPKFCVASTHEYQSKKRHHDDMAAAAAVSGHGHGHQDRHVRQRDRHFRDRNDNHRPGHHDRQGRHFGGGYNNHMRGRGNRFNDRDRGDRHDRDRPRDRSRERERDRDRDRHHDRDRSKERDRDDSHHGHRHHHSHSHSSHSSHGHTHHHHNSDTHHRRHDAPRHAHN